MKQSIKILEAHNEHRCGEASEQYYPADITRAIDDCIKAAKRYEVLRTLTTDELGVLYARNLFGENFDTMADGLVKARGISCAVVALTPEAAKQSAQAETIEADKPKGGALAKLAGQWCNDYRFWDWINRVDMPLIATKSEPAAASFIYSVCNIESRAELDNNSEAAEKFHRLIRIPYGEFLKNHD